MPSTRSQPAGGIRPVASTPAARRPLVGRGAMIAIAFVIAGCAGPEPAAVALDPADYAWCNATAEVCTGWRGEGPFIVGATTPVGVWILPAAAGEMQPMSFLPGAPIVSGDALDLY